MKMKKNKNLVILNRLINYKQELIKNNLISRQKKIVNETIILFFKVL